MITEQIQHVVEVHEDGTLFVKRRTLFLKDGVVIGESQPHRAPVMPGESIVEQPSVVQAIAGAVWSPEMVEKAKREKP